MTRNRTAPPPPPAPSQIPGTGDAPPGEAGSAPPPSLPPSNPPELEDDDLEEPEIEYLTIRIPICRGAMVGHCVQRMDASLSMSQARVMKGVRFALDATNAKLANGRAVKTDACKAIQWIVDQVVTQLQKKTSGVPSSRSSR